MFCQVNLVIIMSLNFRQYSKQLPRIGSIHCTVQWSGWNWATGSASVQSSVRRHHNIFYHSHWHLLSISHRYSNNQPKPKVFSFYMICDKMSSSYRNYILHIGMVVLETRNSIQYNNVVFVKKNQITCASYFHCTWCYLWKKFVLYFALCCIGNK